MSFTTEQAFALKLMLAVIGAGWFIVWGALRHQPERVGRWLDVYLAALVGGLIGARLLYVACYPDFYLQYPLYIPRLWFAELLWPGALMGGGLAVWGVSRWRDVPFAPFADALALGLPLLLMGSWYACRSAGCGLGAPTSLEEQPVWAAAFLPDLARDVTVRYELQMLGVACGALILAVITGLTLIEKGAGVRLWLSLGLCAAAMLILNDQRAEIPHRLALLNWRLDQMGAWLGVAVSLSAALWSGRRGASKHPDALMERL